jgi:D-proline reductase (dithiol) PrdB
MRLTVTEGMQSEIYVPVTPPPVWAPMIKPISECKIGLASACGVHMKSQEPFKGTGDYTYREIPGDVDIKELMVTHGGYDNTDVNRDINCMYPLQRLHELKAEGFIKDISSVVVGFMGGGGIESKFREYTGPEVAKIMKREGVDAVLLTAG